MKVTNADPFPPRPGVTCPRCHQLLKLKKPPRGFRCANGHEFPVETLLVLKARRLERLLREPLASLEKLATSLGETPATVRPEDVQSVHDHHAAAAAREVERLRRAVDDHVVVRALSASATADKAARDDARRVDPRLPSEPDAPSIEVV